MTVSHITRSMVTSFEIGESCAQRFPCLHPSCKITLADGREKTVSLDGDEIYTLIAAVAKDKIKGSDPHFDNYKDFKGRKNASSAEDILARIWPEPQVSNGGSFTEPVTEEAKAQEALAQYEKGLEYFNGISVEKDEAKALECFQLAINSVQPLADQGIASAQNNLANIYCFAKPVQDYSKAIAYYTKAADQGAAIAQHNLGDMYLLGKGVEQNFDKAFEEYTRAANQHHANAHWVLGCMYEKGYGREKNMSKAMEHYKTAAELGSEYAKQHLADNLGFVAKISRGFKAIFN